MPVRSLEANGYIACIDSLKFFMQPERQVNALGGIELVPRHVQDKPFIIRRYRIDNSRGEVTILLLAAGRTDSGKHVDRHSYRRLDVGVRTPGNNDFAVFILSIPIL